MKFACLTEARIFAAGLGYSRVETLSEVVQLNVAPSVL